MRDVVEVAKGCGCLDMGLIMTSTDMHGLPVDVQSHSRLHRRLLHILNTSIEARKLRNDVVQIRLVVN